MSTAPAQAQPESPAPLEVTGSIVATTPRLQVRVVVRNRGEQAVGALTVSGEWLGQANEGRSVEAGSAQARGAEARAAARVAEARIATGLAAGSSGSVVLDFDGSGVPPGLYALVLLLEHATSGAPDAAGNPPLASQRAGLLLSVGEGSAAALRLAPEPCRLAVSGRLDVAVESADLAAHRVRLRAFTPRGLRADGDGVELAVPASGSVRASLPLVRAGAARGSEHGVVVVAEIEGAPAPSAALASATVRVAADPSLFPRLRPAIFALGGLLLLLAAAVEAVRSWRG